MSCLCWVSVRTHDTIHVLLLCQPHKFRACAPTCKRPPHHLGPERVPSLTYLPTQCMPCDKPMSCHRTVFALPCCRMIAPSPLPVPYTKPDHDAGWNAYTIWLVHFIVVLTMFSTTEDHLNECCAQPGQDSPLLRRAMCPHTSTVSNPTPDLKRAARCALQVMGSMPV